MCGFRNQSPISLDYTAVHVPVTGVHSSRPRLLTLLTAFFIK